MNWVAVPNKHDGKGFRRLMRQKNAAAMYGCWHLILQVASKCPVRGVLADEDGPMTAESLELLTGIDAVVFAQSIAILMDIGWLESDGISAPSACHQRAISAMSDSHQRPIPTEQDITVQDITLQNSTEQKEKTGDSVDKFPDELVTHKAKIDDWLKYKQERKESYKPMGLRSFYTKLVALKREGHDIDQAIIDSMANGWKGVYTSQIRNNGPSSKHAKSISENELEDVRRTGNL